MKRNELNDLKGKTVDELSRLLMDARNELSKIEIDLSLSKSKNLNQARNKRKDIARILTILSMKAAIAESSGEPKGRTERRLRRERRSPAASGSETAVGGIEH